MSSPVTSEAHDTPFPGDTKFYKGDHLSKVRCIEHQDTSSRIRQVFHFSTLNICRKVRKMNCEALFLCKWSHVRQKTQTLRGTRLLQLFISFSSCSTKIFAFPNPLKFQANNESKTISPMLDAEAPANKDSFLAGLKRLYI
jgi:hypothetical protein